MNDRQRHRALEILKHAAKLGEQLQERIESHKELSPNKIASLDDKLLEELSVIGFWIDQLGEEFLTDD